MWEGEVEYFRARRDVASGKMKFIVALHEIYSTKAFSKTDKENFSAGRLWQNYQIGLIPTAGIPTNCRG